MGFRQRMRRNYVEVEVTAEVEVAEVLEAIDDDTLMDEIRRRGGAIDIGDDVKEAYLELKRGRPLEALAILDRVIHPKFRDIAVCKEAYAKSQEKMI